VHALQCQIDNQHAEQEPGEVVGSQPERHPAQKQNTDGHCGGSLTQPFVGQPACDIGHEGARDARQANQADLRIVQFMCGPGQQ